MRSMELLFSIPLVSTGKGCGYKDAGFCSAGRGWWKVGGDLEVMFVWLLTLST